MIPPKYQFRIVDLKHRFTKFRETHYSQNGEDIILNNIFNLKSNGFYVDVGAHHPYRISNTYLLHKRGWRGINIDANPETISIFKHARPNDINVNIGVSNSGDSLTYYQFSDPAVNTFSENDAKKWQLKKWITFLGTSEVKTDTLSNILSTHLPSDQSIDLLSVDVEGLDLEVLQSNDWGRFKPEVIIVEDHTFTLNKSSENAIYEFLTSQGYMLEHKLHYSLIFKSNQSN